MMTSNKLSFISILIALSILFNCNCDESESESALAIVDRNDMSDNEVESEARVEDVSDEDEGEVELFSPTHHWQTIRKGQIIPPGLHVRINLATGLKEAKIIDEKDSSDSAEREKIEVIDRHKKVLSDANHVSKSSVSRERIENALKMIRFGKNANAMNDVNDNHNEVITKKSTFRSIEQIKREFDEINLEMNSETEILANLLKKYSKSSTEEKLILLNDIEYLVHQLDVAQDFVTLGGLDLLLPDLNSTNSLLRAQIAFTIGSSSQGNPNVQIALLESQVIHKLLRLIGFDSSDQVRLRALFAVSCLIRQFPTAQQVFVESGGLSVFASLFKDKSIQSMKLNVKAITLLNDIIIEHKFALKYASNEKLTQNKLKQYQQIELSKILVSEGFCGLIPNLLNYPDYDAREKVINAMNSFAYLCRDDFKNSLPVLKLIIDELSELSRNERNSNSREAYIVDLYQLTTNLFNKLNSNIKDEL